MLGEGDEWLREALRNKVLVQGTASSRPTPACLSVHPE